MFFCGSSVYNEGQFAKLIKGVYGSVTESLPMYKYATEQVDDPIHGCYMKRELTPDVPRVIFDDVDKITRSKSNAIGFNNCISCGYTKLHGKPGNSHCVGVCPYAKASHFRTRLERKYSRDHIKDMCK
jgi:ferredoxin